MRVQCAVERSVIRPSCAVEKWTVRELEREDKLCWSKSAGKPIAEVVS